jgi:hypothetical protein
MTEYYLMHEGAGNFYKVDHGWVDTVEEATVFNAKSMAMHSPLNFTKWLEKTVDRGGKIRYKRVTKDQVLRKKGAA